jgi:hypothetical protein
MFSLGTPRWWALALRVPSGVAEQTPTFWVTAV